MIHVASDRKALDIAYTRCGLWSGMMVRFPSAGFRQQHAVTDDPKNANCVECLEAA